jgi:hypothetical protein
MVRILRPLSVFASSSVYALAFYNAARHHVVTPGFLMSPLIFFSIGGLSFAGIYFIVALPKANEFPPLTAHHPCAGRTFSKKRQWPSRDAFLLQ